MEWNSELQQYEAVSQNSEMPHQARNHLGILGGAKSFWEGPKFFELCPVVLNYVQHIVPRGRQNFTITGYGPVPHHPRPWQRYVGKAPILLAFI